MQIHSMSDFSLTHRNFVVPQDPQMREFMEAVDSKSKSDVGFEFGIVLDYKWVANTIANAAFEAIIGYMSTHLDDEHSKVDAFNFYNMFHAFVTVKKNENAEKEGNINLMFEPGSTALSMIDNPPEEETHRVQPIVFFGFPENRELNDLYSKIDRIARYDLSKRYSIVLADDMQFATFAVLYVVFRNIYARLLYTLGSDPKQTLASVNFNDNVEIHAMRKDDGIIFSLRPGMNAKLLIKSDELTEDELGDD